MADFSNKNTKQTIIAFARLACMLVTTGLSLFGVAVDADALFTGAMILLALASYIWAWWKNNNVTTAATEAQEYLDTIKISEKTVNTLK